MAGEIDEYRGSFGEPIDTRLKVLSWNIWWRYGPWEQRRPAIESTIERCEPDVIALQEVWSDGGRDQAAILSERFGMEHRYEARIEREGIRFGNAILSRWPISHSASRDLPALEERCEGRLVLLAQVDGPRGAFRLFSTHLNYRLDHSHVRQAQVREIATFISSQGPSGFPPILCGDFNAAEESDEIRLLTGDARCAVPGLVFRQAWRNGSDGGPGYTWDNRNPFVAPELEPNKRIDHIFVGEPLTGGAGHVVRCRLVGNEPVDGMWPSDHFGLLAELRY